MNLLDKPAILIGRFAVDSGQAMVGDPCYLNDWDTNKNDEWNLEGKIGKYSYQGASATTLENSYGELEQAKAVVFNTGYGDGIYSVYATFENDNETIAQIVIDFTNNLLDQGND
jgi:hypothetical protein